MEPPQNNPGEEHAPDDDMGLEKPQSCLSGLRFRGEDGLGNATAFGAMKISPGQPRYAEKARRCQQPGPPRRNDQQPAQPKLRDVGHLREQHRHDAHRDRRAPEHEPGSPVVNGKDGASSVADNVPGRGKGQFRIAGGS
jgi:hypothetical protein